MLKKIKNLLLYSALIFMIMLNVFNAKRIATLEKENNILYKQIKIMGNDIDLLGKVYGKLNTKKGSKK